MNNISITVQELYRGEIKVYENLTDFLFDIKSYIEQQIPITINYMKNFDTMTQHKKKVVSAENPRGFVYYKL